MKSCLFFSFSLSLDSGLGKAKVLCHVFNLSALMFDLGPFLPTTLDKRGPIGCIIDINDTDIIWIT